MNSVLIIDDDKELCTLMKKCVEQENLSAVVAHGGLEGLRLLEENKDTCSLIILDVMMPEMNGISAMVKIREKSNVPVILLTAKSEDTDKILGLTVGADDYVTKPFSPKELVLRVASVLKRCEHTPGSVIAEYGPFTFDKNALKFYIDKEEVDLTATEFKLMVYMIEREGQTLNRNDLLSCVWGYSHQAQSRTLDTHMKRLRQKLAPYADCIETVRSIGYRFLLPGRRPRQEPA